MSNLPTETVVQRAIERLEAMANGHTGILRQDEAVALRAELGRLLFDLDMAHDQIRSLQRRVPPRNEPIRTHVREG
jgi:hypothetical protein